MKIERDGSGVKVELTNDEWDELVYKYRAGSENFDEAPTPMDEILGFGRGGDPQEIVRAK